MPKIGLVEVFRSVQGEGFNTGRAAIFVRFVGCNLSCVFAEGAVCDTPYQKANMFASDVADLFARYVLPLTKPSDLLEATSLHIPSRNDGALMLILTGGEPTLQPMLPAIIDYAHHMGFYVAIETNGTRWLPELRMCDWICVSPKGGVVQGSPALAHNHNPGSPVLDALVTHWLAASDELASGEYRYVVGPDNNRPPLYDRAFRHYVSPTVLSDGTGTEWKTGFPGFVPGALERCLEIVHADPRWRLSIQTHKILKQR